MFNYLFKPTDSNENVFVNGFLKKTNMKVNAKVVDNSYLFEIALPGYKKEAIKLSVDDGNFTITVERKLEETTGNEKVLKCERFYGKETRSFYVGNVKKDEIKASYNNGILNVVIPQNKEELAVKNIEIE